MATTISKLDGFHKEIYANKLQNLVPDNANLVNLIKFKEEEKIGKSYNIPVVVADEAGFTYLGPDAGIVTLDDAIGMETQNANVDAYQIYLNVLLEEKAALRATKSAAAYGKATKEVMKSTVRSITNRLEISFLHGQVGLGDVVIDSAVEDTSTRVRITVSEGTWASGIFSGKKGALFNVYNLTEDALVSSGADAVFSLHRIDTDNRYVYLNGTATGVDAVVAKVTTDDDECRLFWKDVHPDSSTWKEGPGLKKIMTNTGTLFSIDASAYDLWKSVEHTVTGQITLGKIGACIAKQVDKGGLNEDVVALINPRPWNDLADQNQSLRVFDSSYSKDGKNGFETLSFHSQAGQVKIVPHNCVKQGEMFILPLSCLKRVGSTEFAMNIDGSREEVWDRHPTKNAYFTRAYAEQQIFSWAPAKMGYISGFTPAN